MGAVPRGPGVAGVRSTGLGDGGSRAPLAWRDGWEAPRGREREGSVGFGAGLVGRLGPRLDRRLGGRLVGCVGPWLDGGLAGWLAG